DGGFRGLGLAGGPDNRSGEWTSGRNIAVLSQWKPREHDEPISRAVTWLLGKRSDGGWTDVGYQVAAGSPPPCVESTTWAILALAAVLDAGLMSADRPALEDALAGGVTWLLANQNDDGGWGSFHKADTMGSRTHPTAMAILSLCGCSAREPAMLSASRPK